MLLRRGADIEARNHSGDTPLMLAASHGGYEDIKIVKMLLDRGADLQATNKHGHTALDLAREHGRTNVVVLPPHTAAKSR